MAPEAPKIDPRGFSRIVEDTEAALEELTSWRRPAPGGRLDAGGALVRIFGRFAELVIERLNRLPEKSFLAFLDLIGTRLEPPQPARVPLTFQLAAGSPGDALVPAGTKVAAQPLEGETGPPPVFETERDLVVTRTRLTAVMVRVPDEDTYVDRTAGATGQDTGPALPRPVPHRLYLGHRALLALPGKKTVAMTFTPADRLLPWPDDVAWEAWDGNGWQSLDVVPSFSTSGSWNVTLDEVPELPEVPAAELFAEGYDPGVVGELGEARSSWLRGRLTKPLAHGTASPPEPVARIDDVRLDVVIDRPDLPPELGFANDLPLDLSTDFLPFGDRPKPGDAFYLAVDELFAKPGGAQATLTFTFRGKANASADLALVWEFWDGREWQLLGPFDASPPISVDDTKGFTADGSVSFPVPDSVVPRQVQGETRHWLRVRIDQGNYGVAESYYPVESSPPEEPPNYFYEPGTYAPPVVRSLRLGWTYDSRDDTAHQAAPDLYFSENDFVLAQPEAGAPFFAFMPTADAVPSLYLGFERPAPLGAIGGKTTGGETGFANRSTALYFGVEDAELRPVVSGETSGDQADPTWEYWNGGEWKLLGTRDETAGLRRRGLVTFVGPADFRASLELGRRAFWLRARPESGQTVADGLGRVLTNTVWASHAETLINEVLGSSNGEPGQVFRTARSPVLRGPELQVGEPEVPSGDELEDLRREEGEDAVVVEHEADRPAAIWVRWHEVPDFYASGPRSRHYTLESATGEVRFGDGRSGLVPPVGRGNVRLGRYRSGGGLEGNREAGAVSQLKGSVPYVDGVVNLKPAAGGAAGESLEAARLRGPRTLRHRDRAVAPADYEDLAHQASSRVARVKLILPPVTAPGTVDLVILPRTADEARPMPSLELLERIRDYVEARHQPTVEFELTPPRYLRVSVRAEVVPERPEAAAEVRAAVVARLATFLHPIRGGPGGEGWDFGQKPHRSDLYALVGKTPGVDHVRHLTVEEEPDEDFVDLLRLMVYSGDHQIILTGSTDEVAP